MDSRQQFESRAPNRDSVVASSNLWPLRCESESGILLTMDRCPMILVAWGDHRPLATVVVRCLPF
jgi:hypothetical protein